MKEIDRLIESALEKGRFHGFQVGVYRDGSALFERSYGDAPDTIYRVYSMTKPVTAAAVMTLVEKGGIEYAHMNRWEEDGAVPCERPILIRDLLNMTSGICYPGTEGCAAQMQLLFDEIQGKVETPKAYTTREVVRMAARVPLAFEPGTKWGYGLSADVLGAVIEEVTGMSLREYYQRTIFEPLGMEDTDFYVPQEKRGRLRALYRIGEKGLKLRPNGIWDFPTAAACRPFSREEPGFSLRFPIIPASPGCWAAGEPLKAGGFCPRGPWNSLRGIRWPGAWTQAVSSDR